MPLIDKVITAVTPPCPPERRIKARSKARDLGRQCEWLALVVQKHEQIEQAIDCIASVADGTGCRQAERELSAMLTGHSIAEEAVLYPAMASVRQKAHSMAAFSEQAHIKVHLAALETLEPMTPPYRAALERLLDAISEHVFDEECSWFPALARTGDAELLARLSMRFIAEYKRYLGADHL
jgi:hypothetical protein